MNFITVLDHVTINDKKVTLREFFFVANEVLLNYINTLFEHRDTALLQFLHSV